MGKITWVGNTALALLPYLQVPHSFVVSQLGLQQFIMMFNKTNYILLKVELKKNVFLYFPTRSVNSFSAHYSILSYGPSPGLVCGVSGSP